MMSRRTTLGLLAGVGAWAANLFRPGKVVAAPGGEAKKFRLRADEIKAIAKGYGSCLATDRITVDGAPVGYMYREASRSKGDSGWRFFAGDESDEYANTPANIGLFDVNTIANYDPSIIPYLGAAVGSAYTRHGDGFKPDRIDAG